VPLFGYEDARNNMRIELEQADLQALAEKVLDLLKPYLTGKHKGQEDAIFDKEALAEYLKVDVSWIDKQVMARGIPFFKLGKYVRFKRGRIDKWLEGMEKPTSPYLKMLNSR
jgi:excisionase family DNA binding protein